MLLSFLSICFIILYYLSRCVRPAAALAGLGRDLTDPESTVFAASDGGAIDKALLCRPRFLGSSRSPFRVLFTGASNCLRDDGTMALWGLAGT